MNSLQEINEVLCPPDQQDDFTAWMCSPDGGYNGAKRLSDGTYVGILTLTFTYAICIGVDLHTAQLKRYCFARFADCLEEFAKLTSFSDEPIGWKARRPEVVQTGWFAIDSAPQDGTTIRTANFTFGYCNWVKVTSWRSRRPGMTPSWLEVDGREGDVYLNPTHWIPMNSPIPDRESSAY